MKIYLTHQVTGANRKILEKNLKEICATLEEKGHKCYSTFLEEVESKNRKKFFGMKPADFLKYGSKFLDKSDAVLAIIFNNKRSEGTLYEIGQAKAKKKYLIIATKKGIDSYIGCVADKSIMFNEVNDLCRKLSRV